MAADQSVRFDWGAAVKLKEAAPGAYRVRQGSVCGFRTVDSAELAQSLDVPLGTVLVLVEGGDGLAAEIPEDQLGLL